MISMLVRYLYELDFEVDSQDKTVPEMHTLANVWCMGERFDIKSLKMAAADKYKIALSRFNIYGNEIGFTIPYFEDFLASVDAVWCQTLRDETPNTNRMLRNQVSMHIQQNIKEWAQKKGCKSRFLESSYRLIFQEIQNQTPDFIMVLTKIRAKYPECLDTESGDKVLGKDSEPIETEVAEDED